MNEALITYILPKRFLMDFSHHMFNLILQSTIDIRIFEIVFMCITKEVIYEML